MWEQIGAIAGVVSALCAVVSIRYLSTDRESEVDRVEGRPFLAGRALFSLLLATSGWCLLVLSYLWIFEPYGPYMRRDEYLQVLGVILAMPALVVFVAGCRLLTGKTSHRNG